MRTKQTKQAYAVLVPWWHFAFSFQVGRFIAFPKLAIYLSFLYCAYARGQTHTFVYTVCLCAILQCGARIHLLPCSLSVNVVLILLSICELTHVGLHHQLRWCAICSQGALLEGHPGHSLGGLCLDGHLRSMVPCLPHRGGTIPKGRYVPWKL